MGTARRRAGAVPTGAAEGESDAADADFDDVRGAGAVAATDAAAGAKRAEERAGVGVEDGAEEAALELRARRVT